MKIEKLQTDNRKIILDKLLGRVFHLTTCATFVEIERTGDILNNQSERFPLNTSSKSSYGRLHGYVCLFDLRNQTPEIIQNTLECYYFLGPPWFSKHGRKYILYNLVYLFLDEQYYDCLIPNSRVHDHYRETGEYLQAIPKSEVWIQNKIPLTWIEKALVVKLKEPAPDRNTPSGMHYWALMKANEEG